jgi:hypothetical protein
MLLLESITCFSSKQDICLDRKLFHTILEIETLSMFDVIVKLSFTAGTAIVWHGIRVRKYYLFLALIRIIANWLEMIRMYTNTRDYPTYLRGIMVVIIW